MSDKITVKEGDRGRVWVFAVDLGDEEIKAFDRRNGTWPVQEALGAETLDPEHVEVFPVSDLEGVGLAGYLSEGMGVPEDQIADMRARLDAQKGWVLVLSSRAFGGTAQTLTPKAPLRLLASLSEEGAQVSFAPLPSEAAAGTVAGSPPSARAERRPRWLGPLLLFAALLAIVILAVLLA